MLYVCLYFPLKAQHSKDQVKEAFELFDSDRDGHLLVGEAASAIRALGHVLTDMEIKNLLTRAGVDSGKCGAWILNDSESV